MHARLVSHRVPFIPVAVTISGVTREFEAMLDTGFDEDVIVPRQFSTLVGPPNVTDEFEMADGSIVRCPIYLGSVRIETLGNFPVSIAALADECLLGLRLASRIVITLDRGQRIVVEA